MKSGALRGSHGVSWRDLSVRLAVALAFADASIVVLALPQIVDELHTTISRVTWVIMSYNVALIAGVVCFLLFGRRVSPRRAMLAGLAVFGVASIGCGASGTLRELVALRAFQGLGGALLLCASLPLLAGAARPGESPSARWAAAAALGAAIGPAAGGALTEVFHWRAIFFAQAPAAALAAAAVVATRVGTADNLEEETKERSGMGPWTANAALALLSAGLIGALFLVVILLINVWLLTPLAAAGVVSAIPLATALVERAARGRSPFRMGATGAILLALGLVGVALISHRQLGTTLIALLLCGTGLGLAFPALSASAMRGGASTTVLAGRTVIARDGGLVLGLLVLTPFFVDDLDKAPQRAFQPVVKAVFGSTVPGDVKGELARGLLKLQVNPKQGSLPDLEPVFAPVRAKQSPATVAQLATIQTRIQDAIERSVTRGFRRSLLYSAVFALLVLPVLGLALAQERRTRLPAPEVSAGAPP